MNAEQKRAWLGVVTITGSIVGYFVLLPFLGPGAAGVFGFLGLNGFGVFIGRGEKADERDKNIARRATLGGFAASYGAFFIGCMGTWLVVFVFQHKEQILVHTIMRILMFGFIAFIFVRSVAILVLYNRHVEAGDG